MRGSWNSRFWNCFGFCALWSSRTLLLPLTEPEQSYSCLLKSRGIFCSGLGSWLPDINWSTSHFFVFSSKGRGQDERGLTLGRVLGFGKTAEFTGDWNEGLDSSLLGLPLALSVLGAEQLPSFMCGSCQLCWGCGPSQAHGSTQLPPPKPTTVAVVAKPHLLPNGLPSHGGGKKEKPEGQRTTHWQHTGEKPHPELTCLLQQ